MEACETCLGADKAEHESRTSQEWNALLILLKCAPRRGEVQLQVAQLPDSKRHPRIRGSTVCTCTCSHRIHVLTGRLQRIEQWASLHALIHHMFQAYNTVLSRMSRKHYSAALEPFCKLHARPSALSPEKIVSGVIAMRSCLQARCVLYWAQKTNTHVISLSRNSKYAPFQAQVSWVAG